MFNPLASDYQHYFHIKKLEWSTTLYGIIWADKDMNMEQPFSAALKSLMNNL